MMSTEIKQATFENFLEYWYFAKTLSNNQRETLFASLPIDQQAKIERSYDRGGWHDVVIRNELNKYIDQIKKEDGYDLLEIRCKVLSGKSVYVPRDFWQKVIKHLDEYSMNDTDFVLSNMKAMICKRNSKVVLLLRENDMAE